MTLNGIVVIILRYFTEFGNFRADYVAVVEVRPTLSATKIQPKESSFRQYMIYDFSS